MEAQAEPEIARGGEDYPRFSDREHALFAENVAVAGETFARGLWKDLADDCLDPVAAAVAVLQRDLVRRQKGRHDPRHLRSGAEVPQKAQGVQLAFDGQAVARLGLDRGRAVGNHERETAGKQPPPSSEADALRVARTVAWIPPPSAAIAA